MQLLSIKVEIFQYGISQSGTVKLTGSGGNFTVSTWQVLLTKRSQKSNKIDVLKDAIIGAATMYICSINLIKTIY